MTMNYYDPTPEHSSQLSASWCASYSGGKDSTALVTWIEWLRRSGQIDVVSPKLVRSDTTVEEPPLTALAGEMTSLLADYGWDCGLVTPDVRERLYPQILGRGLPPIHPGARRMRWCTRSTKIDPMNRWKNGTGVQLWLTGLRFGESAMRDGKLQLATCSAGGECGIPEPGEGRYSPILHWKTCQVIDWLNGHVEREVRDIMGNIFAITKRLIEVYDFTTARTLFDEQEIISSARFGCIGCPAIGAESSPPRSVVKRNGVGSPLNELYDVWHEARMPINRLAGVRKGKVILGPIRIEARMRLFARVMNIQSRAGVMLIAAEDEAFIRSCWGNKVYPRGWSEADEAVSSVGFGDSAGPLYDPI